MKKYFFLTAALMTMYFSWFLSFPYFGSILTFVSGSYVIDGNQVTLTFTLFHALGFLSGALFLKNNSLWKSCIIFSLAMLITLNMMLLLLPSILWIPLMALIGLISSLFILGWSVLFSTFSTLEKIQLYAASLFGANLFNLSLLFFSNHFSAEVLLLTINLPLAVAFILFLYKKPVIKKDIYGWDSVKEFFPTRLVSLLFIVTFLLHFSFGFMFAVVDSSFSFMEYNTFASTYFRYIPYLLTCILICLSASLVKLRYLVYAAISLFGLAYAFFALFDQAPAGFFLTSSMVESAVVILSVCVWVALGDLSFDHKVPYRFFGFGLFTTLLGVFAGGALGSYLLATGAIPVLTAALAAIAIIFVALLAFPWLLDNIGKVLPAIMEKDSLLPPLDPLAELDAIYKKAGLTEREIEIANQLCQGHTNRKIAETLYITENTLKTHLKKIYSKLGVRRKSELISKLANRSLPEVPSKSMFEKQL